MIKTGKVNDFELFAPYEIENLETFKLIEGTNQVLVEVYKEDTEKSIGGIITEGLRSFNFADHTERRGKIIKTVSKIVPGKSGVDTMMWDCDVDIQPGDEVYFKYFDNINSYIYKHKDRYFSLMPYSAIILAIRNKQVIMCNGYVLLEKLPPDEKIGSVYIPRKNRDKEGIIRYLGKPNKRHFIVIQPKDLQRYRVGNPDTEVYRVGEGYMLLNNPKRSEAATDVLKIGDHIIVDDSRWLFDLEVYTYARFDDRKVYTVCPRHCIASVLN